MAFLTSSLARSLDVLLNCMMPMVEDPGACRRQHLVLSEADELSDLSLSQAAVATPQLLVGHVVSDGVALEQAGAVRTLESRNLSKRELFDEGIGLVGLAEDKLVINLDVGV